MPRFIDLNNPKIIHTGRDKFGNGIYHIPPDLQAADVVGVKHGKWKQGCCSECGYDWGKDVPIASVPNYCPNCGAKMRKETEE